MGDVDVCETHEQVWPCRQDVEAQARALAKAVLVAAFEAKHPGGVFLEQQYVIYAATKPALSALRAAQAEAERRLAAAEMCDGCGRVPPVPDDGKCGCHGEGRSGMLRHARIVLAKTQDALEAAERRAQEADIRTGAWIQVARETQEALAARERAAEQRGREQAAEAERSALDLADRILDYADHDSACDYYRPANSHLSLGARPCDCGIYKLGSDVADRLRALSPSPEPPRPQEEKAGE